MVAMTQKKSVLVVEDNELNMKLFHDLLEAQGYTIIQTKDGMEAYRRFRGSRSRNGSRMTRNCARFP
jgi:two-component system cell cycle response regulator DivK